MEQAIAMKVTQNSSLFTTQAGSGSAAASLNASSSRNTADYYSTNAYIFSTTDLTSTVSIVDTVNGGYKLFSFRNDIDTSDPSIGDYITNHDAKEKVPVAMTAQFVNSVKTAAIQIKKNVTGSTSNTNFGFEIELSNVFGVSTVAFNNHGDLVSVKNGGSPTTANITGTNKGAFTLQNGDTLTISGIPVHTKYKITETSGRGQTVTGEVEESTEIPTTADGTTITVTVENIFQSETGVDVLKKNSNGDPLDGAEFELWYKETLTPPTYIFNEAETVPNQLNTMKVTATPGELGVPGYEIPPTITTYKYTTTYTAPELPSVTDTDWILPRNDTDYIYFRDYNTGTPGWEDSASFNDIAKDAANTNGSDGKRSWRGTEFDKHTGHNQNLELFFDDNDNYWMAAEFSGNGKKTIR